MSQRWDQLEERLSEYESELDALYQLYHIPVLAAIMVFMLWVRVRNWRNFFQEDGSVLFAGNDAWYHYRSTNYVLENYPYTMPYDVWTGFDEGATAGQFGTIFDQLIATAILVVGLGDPSQFTTDLIFILAPAVIGVLCAIPVFLLGKRFGGRFGGLVAVTILALTPGTFLTRSTVGFTDHHVMETLFQATALLAFMTMFTVAQREQPIIELFRTREFDVLKQPLVWAAVAAIATLLYILTWPPGIFFVGILGFAVLIHLVLEYLQGHSPDHVAIPFAISMGLFTVLFLPLVTSFSLSSTDPSLVQPLIALVVGGGAFFMAVLARLLDGRDLPKTAYPASIVTIGVLGIGIVAVAAPDVFDFFTRQLVRVFGMESSDTAGTVGEAQSIDNPTQFFYRSYGLAFYTAIIGFALVLYRLVTSDRPRGEHTILLVYTVLILLATLTQRRFDYYFVIAVGTLNAYLVYWVFQFVDLEDVRRDITNVQPYQVLVVVAIIFIIAGPLAVVQAPVAATSHAGPGSVQNWDGSLEWMSEETPAEGAYGSGDAPRLEKYGTYERTDDFQYEDGEYGVMAWWDYGHWITVLGDRIPVANPFQQHAGDAADFLLAADEDRAIDILEEDNNEGEGVRYVMVDYQLGYAGTLKYNAPVVFESKHDLSRSDIGITVLNRNRQRLYGVHTQRAYESMRVRLYQFHGSAREPARFITRFGAIARDEGYASVPQDGRPVRFFNTSEEAAAAAERNPNAIHGGVLGQPAERVEALQHFRLVHASRPSAPSPFRRVVGQRQQTDSWVKTFERVDGATIQGTGPANATVQTSVEMRIPTTGKTFTYKQFAETDENGDFTMVVPYSTTGYEQFGPENGHTNVSVRATGPYQFRAFPQDSVVPWQGQATVTEAQVLGEDETPVTVDLQPPEQGTNQSNDQQQAPS